MALFRPIFINVTLLGWFAKNGSPDLPHAATCSVPFAPCPDRVCSGGACVDTPKSVRPRLVASPPDTCLVRTSHVPPPGRDTAARPTSGQELSARVSPGCALDTRMSTGQWELSHAYGPDAANRAAYPSSGLPCPGRATSRHALLYSMSSVHLSCRTLTRICLPPSSPSAATWPAPAHPPPGNTSGFSTTLSVGIVFARLSKLSTGYWS